MDSERAATTNASPPALPNSSGADLRRLAGRTPSSEISLVDQVIDAVPSPAFYKDVDGRYLGCNKAFESFCGMRREELIGKKVFDVLPKELAETYPAADLELFRHPGTQIHNAQLRYADGSLHDVVLHRSTFSRADGSVGGIAGVAWDVTDRVCAERALQDQLHLVQQLIETIPSPAFFKDANGKYIGCNRAFEVFCAVKRSDLIGKTVFEIWPSELANVYHAADEALLKKPGTQVYEAALRYADGSHHEVIFHRATFNKADGSLGGIVGIAWDVTERKRAERALRHSEERLRRIVENAPFGVRVTDAKDAIVFVNRRFEELIQYPLEQMATLDEWRARAYPDPKYRAEIAANQARDVEAIRSGKVTRLPPRDIHVACGDGVTRDMEVFLAVEDDLVYSMYNDVTERNRAEQALRDVLQAETLHDPLTSLFNRRYMDQVMEREFARASRSGKSVAVIMADIDHFKKVNDAFGHDCGDEVLRVIARQLSASVRKGDTVCRYGGEEFVLVLPETSVEIACERAERLRGVIGQLSVSSNGQPIGRVTISLGVAAYPQHGDRPEAVLKAADEALLRAKREGRDRVASAYHFRPAG